MTVLSPESEELVEDHFDVGRGRNKNDESSVEEPKWLTRQREQGRILEEWGELLQVPEWQNETNSSSDSGLSYRLKNGWHGRDLIHDVRSPVRITEYYVKYGKGQGLPQALFPEGTERRGGVGTVLTGIVVFTTRAESHKGFCHGGSMCSVLDDAIGWCGFVATGCCRPWSGFTVQINTRLQKPIPVRSILLVRATVTQIERRKVFIDCELVDPSPLLLASATTVEESITHASGDGLVVLNKGVLPELATRGSLHSWPSSIAMT